MSGKRALVCWPAWHSCSAGGPASAATELTILWAEWDPANYLQELVNEYEKETGVKVTVETTAWPGFQTKAFAEFNAKGDAYDMVVGNSQWLGAGSTGGHYVDLTDFFAKHEVGEADGSGHGEILRRVSGQQRQVLGDPARGRRHRLGLPQRLVRGSRRRWRRSRPSMATISPCRRLQGDA